MALGARRREIVLWVVATARAPLAAGVVLGLAGSLAWERAFSVDRAGAVLPDPLVVAIVAAGVGIMALAACVLPARRAAALDPARALRLD
jgi:ABC-type antimicrobial peptide transport system permease subunit